MEVRCHTATDMLKCPGVVEAGMPRWPSNGIPRPNISNDVAGTTAGPTVGTARGGTTWWPTTGRQNKNHMIFKGLGEANRINANWYYQI